jgi:eukaryotic-like serine/threonine-protein kinase
VLVNPEGKLHLIDFGIAKTQYEPSALSELGHSPMTPRYAAPEQRSGGPITTATDQWQIAALAYELLSVAPANAAQSDAEAHTETQSSTGIKPRLLKVNRSISRDLDAVVMKALRSEASERYASVAQLALDLRAARQGRPVQARMSERYY